MNNAKKEENNVMGETRDLFRKNQSYQGNISHKDEHDKRQKWQDFTETEEKEAAARIHRRTVKKDLHDQDNHKGVITHLEPDIPECEVKRALGIIIRLTC